MGQSIAVEAPAVELKDFFRLGQAPASVPQPERRAAAAASAGHHIRAWKFDGRGRSVVDSPVALCDEQGLFSAELRRESSYLILHVRPPPGNTTEGGGVAEEALKELAANACSACSPRGLAIEVVSHGEAIGRGAGGPGVGGLLHAAVRYAVFVWHGLGVDPLVKAHTMGKAFELDRVLRHGLLKQPDLAEDLRCGVSVKGLSRSTARSTESSTEDGCQPRRNRLLSSMLTSSRRPASASQGGACAAPMTPRSAGGSRFPRLGVSVCRSLGVAVPATGGWLKDSRWAQSPRSPLAEAARPGPQRPQVAAPSPAPSPAPGSAASAGSSAGATPGVAGRVRNGIAIPRLALGALLSSPPQEGPLGTAPAQGLMDVDDGSSTQDSCDGSGRKRRRDPDNTRPPLSARGAPATPSAVAGAAAVPAPAASARTEVKGAMPAICETPPRTGGKPKVVTPTLNLAGIGGRKSIGNRSDAPAMLNLEEINMTEEEMMASYDPDCEENNYHLPHHVYKQLQLKHFRQVCSEVIPGKLFISSFQVAGDLAALQGRQITHIVNTAADICESRYPEHFQYLTYYLKDTNNEDISLLFYRTLDWIQHAIDSGGRVLVHCREGVSRSATMVIAYLMWRFSLPFDAAHEKIRKVRPICNPNTGFTCQLLMLGRKLSGASTPTQRPGQPADKPGLFRVAPYHPKEPFLLLLPSDWPSAGPLFDPRFGWVVQHGATLLLLWLGAQVPNAQAVRDVVDQHIRWLETFERCCCSLVVAEEGQETQKFWQALGMHGPPPAEAPPLAALREAFDDDFELLRAAGLRGQDGTAYSDSSTGSSSAGEDLCDP